MRKPSTSDLGTAARSVQEIAIEQPRTLGVFLEVTGTAPLIQNNFGQKTIEEMLKKHMGITTIREKKKPSEACERAKIYNLDKRICMPPSCRRLLAAETNRHLAHLYLCAEVLGALDLAASAREAVAA